jgi:ribosomal protein L13E
LSSRPGKKKSEEKAPPRTQVKTVQVRPSGRAPTPTVLARHGIGMVIRTGKGFSNGELSEANIVSRLASEWGVRLDGRRRSVLESNVASLKSWGSHVPKAERPTGEVKRAQEELVKVEKKVKKDAAEAKKEVAKIEAKVKREPTRAKKKAKKAERPKKTRPKKKSKK